MHSSSGVSSTGSLHLSIGSEWEDSTASTGTVVTATHIYRNLSASTPKDNDIQNGKISARALERKRSKKRELKKSVSSKKRALKKACAQKKRALKKACASKKRAHQ